MYVILCEYKSITSYVSFERFVDAVSAINSGAAKPEDFNAEVRLLANFGLVSYTLDFALLC